MRIKKWKIGFRQMKMVTDNKQTISMKVNNSKSRALYFDWRRVPLVVFVGVLDIASFRFGAVCWRDRCDRVSSCARWTLFGTIYWLGGSIAASLTRDGLTKSELGGKSASCKLVVGNCDKTETGVTLDTLRLRRSVFVRGSLSRFRATKLCATSVRLRLTAPTISVGQ